MVYQKLTTINNLVSKAYFFKTHCHNGCLRNDVCTTLRPSLRWREAAVQKGNYKLMDPFLFSDIDLKSSTPWNIHPISMAYISAVFGLIAMNWSPYSPTVTWCMCAKFAAFTISGTRQPLAFGQVVVAALYPNGLSVWVPPWSCSSWRMMHV